MCLDLEDLKQSGVGRCVRVLGGGGCLCACMCVRARARVCVCVYVGALLTACKVFVAIAVTVMYSLTINGK